MTFLRLKKNREAVLAFLGLLAIFLSYSSCYFVAIFPGEFLLQSLAMLLTLRWLASAFTRRFFYRLPWLLLTTIALLFWALLSLLWTEHPALSPDGLLRTFTFVALTIGCWDLLADYRSLHSHLWDICLAALTLISAGYFAGMVLSFYRSGSIFSGRFGFPFANPNLGASIVGFAMIIAMAKALLAAKNRQWRRSSCYGTLTMFLAIVVWASASKGALLAVVVTTALLLLLLFPRYWWLFCLLAVLALSGAWCYRALWEPAVKASLQIRLWLWKSSWSMAIFTPWRLFFGWGPGNFFPNFPDFQMTEMLTSFQRADLVHFPHNYFLETLVEYGIVGSLLLAALLAQTGYWAWRLWHHDGHDKCRENALAVLAGVFMLLIHAQVSVAFSYIQVQLWLALAIAWLAAYRPQKARCEYWQPVAKAALVLLLPLLLLVWKYCCWDFLLFHRDFKSACRDKLPEKMASLLAVSRPGYENFYSLHWRYELGTTLVEYYDINPLLVDQCAQDFLVIEEIMPKFGLFRLTKAMLLARQGKKKLAEIYFQRFAAYDPFCHHLWRGWAIACRLLGLDARTMLYTARYYQRRYPLDGATLLGEALAWHLLGETMKARQLMTRICQWRRQYRQRWLPGRIVEISAWAEQYLRNSKK